MGLGLVFLSVPLTTAAQPSGQRVAPTLRIPRVDRPPTLEDFAGMKAAPEMDGRMAKVEGFIQREPSDGHPATQRTEVYLGYDDSKLYAIFVCFDAEPGKVRARLLRRGDDLVLADDTVNLYLDTFQDQRRAYVFAANPLGVQIDAIWTEQAQGFDNSFDTVWDSKGRRTEQGYLVWMAIPFKSLRFPQAPQQTWGVVVERVIPRVNETAAWPQLSSRVQGRLNQAARLVGLENISPGRNLQFIPYATFRSFRSPDFRDAARPRFAQEAGEAEAGLDAKLVFQDSLVLDITVNPDFAQVESDEPQVTVAQRFEVFFPEKRPFFLENASFFETPFNLVFTRRIADPRLGARLTGKLGPYALGALVVDDEAPGKLLPPSDPLHGRRALVGIFRGSRDLFRQSSLGFIYTGREFEGSYNRLTGVDGRFKFGEHWVASFQGITTWTRELDSTQHAGPAYKFQVERSGRQLYYFNAYTDISRGFHTDLGFVPRTDIRHWAQFAAYAFRPEGRWLIAWGPESNTEVVFDHNGTRLDLTQDTEFGLELVGQTQLELFFNWDRERLRPVDFPALPANQDFSRHRQGFRFETSLWQPLTAGAEFSWGTRINFVPLEGTAPALANVSSAEVTVTLRPLTRLQIDNTYLHTRLGSHAERATIFNNHILRSKWNWQFTREFSLRVILQYDATLANSALTALETRKNLNADVLFTYLVNPWTALYVGYNGNAQNLDPALFLCEGPGVARPGCPDLAAGGRALLRPRDRLINDARQLFVKASYLFRF